MRGIVSWTSGAGTCSSGIGAPMKRFRQGRASQRAIRTERAVRAESVAMPVFAYMLRYSFESSTNANRPRTT